MATTHNTERESKIDGKSLMMNVLSHRYCEYAYIFYGINQTDKLSPLKEYKL